MENPIDQLTLLRHHVEFKNGMYVVSTDNKFYKMHKENLIETHFSVEEKGYYRSPFEEVFFSEQPHTVTLSTEEHELSTFKLERINKDSFALNKNRVKGVLNISTKNDILYGYVEQLLFTRLLKRHFFNPKHDVAYLCKYNVNWWQIDTNQYPFGNTSLEFDEFFFMFSNQKVIKTGYQPFKDSREAIIDKGLLHFEDRNIKVPVCENFAQLAFGSHYVKRIYYLETNINYDNLPVSEPKESTL